MAIGSGIFLATVVLALGCLYRITSPRWSRRKRRPKTALKADRFQILGVILVVLGAAAYGWIAWRPQKQTQYADLRLGMTMAEVKYVKGDPSYVLEISEPNGLPPLSKSHHLVIPVRELETSQRVEEYFSWSFDLGEPGSRIDVDFDNSTKRLIRIGCFSKSRSSCPAIFGLQGDTSEDQIVSRLGKPDKETIEGVTKKLEYTNLHVWFVIEERKIYMLGLVE
jgi:hypothetical protein